MHKIHPLLIQASQYDSFRAGENIIEELLVRLEPESKSWRYREHPGVYYREEESIRIVYRDSGFSISSPQEFSKFISNLLSLLIKHDLVHLSPLIKNLLDQPSEAFRYWHDEPLLENILFTYILEASHHRDSYCPTPTMCPIYIITVDFKKSALALACAALIGGTTGAAIGGFEFIPIIKGVLGVEAAASIAMIISLLKQSNETQDQLSYLRRYVWPQPFSSPERSLTLLQLNLRPQTVAEISNITGINEASVQGVVTELNNSGLIELDEGGKWKLTMPLSDLFFIKGRDERGKYLIEGDVLLSFLISVIRRNLRKYFGDSKPNSEIDVQKALSILLSAAGLDFKAESPEFAFSVKRFRPDFSFEPLAIAIEVKLVKEKRQVKRIVEEMAADITSYRSRFKYLLFVIYDLGFIEDEWQFSESFRGRNYAEAEKIEVIIQKH